MSDPIADGGMTLRDWFAGQALMGELSAEDNEATPEVRQLMGADYWANIASNCYAMADAMLAERQKKTQEATE